MIRTKWVKVNGHTFKKEAAVLYDIKKEQMEVGIITNIFVVNCAKIMFKINCFYISKYENHYVLI